MKLLRYIIRHDTNEADVRSLESRRSCFSTDYWRPCCEPVLSEQILADENRILTCVLGYLEKLCTVNGTSSGEKRLSRLTT